MPAARACQARGREREPSPNRRAIFLLAFAVAALSGFGSLAALPALGGGARVALAALGYFSFVGIFSAAMRRWRADWDVLTRSEST
jgi:hypothetical protein